MNPQVQQLQEQLNILSTQFTALAANYQYHAHTGADQTQPLDKGSVVVQLASATSATITPLFDRITIAKITPTAAVTITSPIPPIGALIFIVVKTSGTTSYTITFGTGFTATATLSTGTVSAVYFTVSFISDGISLREVSRTVAMQPS